MTQSPADETTEELGGARLTAQDPVYRERPHERLDRLRAADPVFQDREFDRVVLTRVADIAPMLADRSLSSDPLKARPTAHSRRGLTEAFRQNITMLHMDGAEHARQRGLVTQAFSARAIEALRPSIAAIAADRLDAIDPHVPFDLLSAYAAPVAALVIAHMLGIEAGDIDQFKAWSDDIVGVSASNPSEAAQRRKREAFQGLRSCIRDVLGARRERPKEDLISSLARAESDGDRLDDTEIVSIGFLLLVGGNATVADLIANGVVALLHRPEQAARLQAEPSLWPRAVEEMLRYDPPATAVSRQSLHAYAIDGCPVEAGQTVTAMLLAANHDPALHADPHAFDIARPGQKHHSFGGGPHFCLGASLARLEAQIVLAALFDRFPRLRFEPGRELRRKAAAGFNGYEAVWLRAA